MRQSAIRRPVFWGDLHLFLCRYWQGCITLVKTLCSAQQNGIGTGTDKTKCVLWRTYLSVSLCGRCFHVMDEWQNWSPGGSNGVDTVCTPAHVFPSLWKSFFYSWNGFHSMVIVVVWFRLGNYEVKVWEYGLHRHPPPQPLPPYSSHPCMKDIFVPGLALDANCRIIQYECNSYGCRAVSWHVERVIWCL